MRHKTIISGTTQLYMVNTAISGTTLSCTMQHSHIRYKTYIRGTRQYTVYVVQHSYMYMGYNIEIYTITHVQLYATQDNHIWYNISIYGKHSHFWYNTVMYGRTQPYTLQHNYIRLITAILYNITLCGTSQLYLVHYSHIWYNKATYGKHNHVWYNKFIFMVQYSYIR